MTGPICIIDDKGVYPERLDEEVARQRRKKIMLARLYGGGEIKAGLIAGQYPVKDEDHDHGGLPE